VNVTWLLSAIANSYAKIGQFDQALQFAQTIDNQYSKARALTEIASQYTAREQKEKASELLAQALQITQAMGSGQ
jgi:tetratricopeptide (TPR) repeat protein